jgi:hypothetical protein
MSTWNCLCKKILFLRLNKLFILKNLYVIKNKMSETTIRLVQENGYNFRAEIFPYPTNKLLLWVAEDDENIYTIVMQRVVKVDTYVPLSDDESCETCVIILYEDEDSKVQTINVGNFSGENAKLFMEWLKSYAVYVGK